MKIIKPQQLALINRMYRQQGSEHLGLAGLLLLDITESPQLCQEAELWTLAQQRLGPCPLDVGLPKAYPEFLVSGYAWGCYCDQDSRCTIGVRLADREKILQVSGRRAWPQGQRSPTERFERLALDWAHTYGGPLTPENPHGYGDRETLQQRPELPQIEYPQHRIQRPGEVGVPAGVMPLPASHPLRHNGRGSYDQAWLEHNYPGFPDDISPAYFNVAPLDQQWRDQPDVLRSAHYELTQLHPGRRNICGQLPDISMLALVGRRNQAEAERLQLKLTTVWLFPDALRLALIFHGHTPLQCFDAADISYLMLAAEQTAQLKPDEWYRARCQERLQTGFIADDWPTDAALLPAALLPTAAPRQRPTRGSVRLRHQQRAAQAELDRAHHELQKHAPHSQAVRLPKALPAAEQTAEPQVANRLRQQASDQQAQAHQQRKHAEHEKQRLLTETRQRGKANEQLEAQLNPSRQGPPHIAPSAKQLLEAAPETMDRAALAAQMEAANHALRQLYQQSAQHQEPVAPASPKASLQRRQHLEQAYRQGLSLAGMDLTGLDLSQIDLRGADLSGALMESVILERARLDGCNLERTVLVRSQIRRSSLRLARLGQANLASATIEDCDFSDSQWDATILEQTHLKRCRFNHSHWRQCHIRQAQLAECDLQQTQLADMVFEELHWRQINLRASQLRKLAFIKCQFTEVDFTATQIHGLAIIGGQLDHLSRFAQAHILKACFIDGVTFDRPDFSAAQLQEVNLRGAQLQGACLAHARLQHCDLSDAALNNADLSHAKFEAVQWVRTDLSDANLEACDLLGAYMRGACLDGTDLRLANLFRANLGEVRLDQHTVLDQAYLQRHSPYPLAPRKSTSI